MVILKSELDPNTWQEKSHCAAGLRKKVVKIQFFLFESINTRYN